MGRNRKGQRRILGPLRAGPIARSTDGRLSGPLVPSGARTPAPTRSVIVRAVERGEALPPPFGARLPGG